MTKVSNQDAGADTDAPQIRDLIREAAKEEGFPLFQLAFGEDSTAAPAVYISFLVHSADTPSATELQAASRLRKRVEAALFEHGISRVPYIRFRGVPERAG